MYSKINILLIPDLINLSAQTIQQLPVEKINPDLLNGRWNAQWISHPTDLCLIMEYSISGKI